MRVVKTREELLAALATVRTTDPNFGFVPTMGALHEGHLSLCRKAKSEYPYCVMSIFVNPTQFRSGEDLDAYPRPLERDLQLAEAAGADLVFVPGVSEIYPSGFSTYVEETEFSQVLCGAFRPGHFRGVCTVVMSLLNLVRPTTLYLGQKDAQQLRILEKMVSDLHLPVRVTGCPTVREADGLAMSSRNTYLTPAEREVAPRFYSALNKAHRAFQGGERAASALIQIARLELKKVSEFQVQYLELRRWTDFQAVETVNDPAILAGALFLGKTRLIDNVRLTPSASLE